MRCPKCGYITFDRVERCGKCAHDLMMVAAQLRGPMAKVAPPMFLGGLLHGEMAAAMDDEVATIDLEGEELDLGEAVALEEELPAVEEAEEPEEEVAIELPSLSGIDVSDLVAPQEEAAPPEMAPEEEVGGIEMPASLMAESTTPAAMAPEPADSSDDNLSLDFDLTGGEARGSATPDEGEEAVGGGVVDLADLLGDIAGAPAAEPEAGPAGGLDDELDLTLEGGDPTPAPPPAEASGNVLDIPDLGLTLESDDEEEKPAS